MKLFNLHVWELTDIPSTSEEWKNLEMFKKEKVETLLFAGKTEKDVLNQYYRSLSRLGIKIKRRSGKIWEYNNSYIYIEVEQVDRVIYHDTSIKEEYKVNLEYKGVV